MGPLLDDLHNQFFTRPPVPTADFSGKTIIVTGANVGLGKEAVKHYVKLHAAKVIIAVRSISKGEAAKTEIERECKVATDVIDVWPLDYSKYTSCKAFAAKVATLDRIDAVVLNAGITTEKFELFEDNESQVTVNVISTVLLALLVLPALRASAAHNKGTTPIISIVGSGVHAYTKFPEQKEPKILAACNDPKKARMSDRYLVTKLMSLFAVRSMAEKTANAKPYVVINTVNPGLCYTDLTRSLTGGTGRAMKVMRAAMAWTAEEGSRTLVHATSVGPESHGVFISGSKIPNNGQSKFVTSPEGLKTQKKLWAEISEKLEKIQPGVTNEL